MPQIQRKYATFFILGQGIHPHISLTKTRFSVNIVRSEFSNPFIFEVLVLIPFLLAYSLLQSHFFPRDLTLSEVFAHKATVESSMAAVIAELKTNPDVDPAIIIQAQTELDLLHSEFVPVSFEYSFEDGAYYTVDMSGCVNRDPCRMYGVTDMNGTIGAYSRKDKYVRILSRIPPDDPYLPFALFHEMLHALEDIRGSLQGTGVGFEKLGAANPAETNAFAFQDALLDGYTHGAYKKLVRATVEYLESPGSPESLFIVRDPGPVVFTQIPHNFFGLFRRPLSEDSAFTFVAQTNLTINEVMIDRDVKDPEEAKERRALLYNYFVVNIRDATIQSLLQKSH